MHSVFLYWTLIAQLCDRSGSSTDVNVKEVIDNWKKRILQEPESDGGQKEQRRRTGEKTTKGKTKASEEFLEQEMLKAKTMVWYDADGIVMYESADRVEGGKLMYNSRMLLDEGPKNIYQVYDMVELAFINAKILEPKRSASFVPVPTKPDQRGFKAIHPKTLHGVVQIVPVNGVAFAHPRYNYGQLRYKSAGDWVDRYTWQSKMLSVNLGTKLRHYVGRTVQTRAKFTPIRCNEGAWVAWDDLVLGDAVWEDANTRNNPETITRQNRLAMYFVQNYECFRMTRRLRFQMLAVRIPLEELRTPYNQDLKNWMNLNGIDETTLVNCGGWCHPVAVRATSAHSTDGHGRFDVQLDHNLIGARISNSMAMDFCTAYHMTTLGAIPSIVRHGLVPGGLGRSGRETSHFAVFPPWSHDAGHGRKKPFTGRRVGYDDYPIVLCVPVQTLQQYGLTVSATGSFLVQDTVLFNEIRGAWHLCNVSEIPKVRQTEWVRLITRENHPENIVVCSYKHGDPDRRGSWKKLEADAIEVQDVDMMEEGKEIVHLLDKIEELDVPPRHGDRLWMQLFQEVSTLRAHREYDYRLCPCCLAEVI